MLQQISRRGLLKTGMAMAIGGQGPSAWAQASSEQVRDDDDDQ